MAIPRSERFFLAVREAWSETQSPLVVSSGAALMSGQAAKVFVERSTRWLTVKTVQDYDPADFQWAEAPLQAKLRESVEAFRAVAGDVHSPEEASYEQTEGGLKTLEVLAGSVRAIVLEDWGQASKQLVDEIKGFLDDKGLSYQYKTKQVEESLLGKYQVPSLVLQSNTRVLVEPVARFVTGACGVYDLSLATSGYTATLFRDYARQWQIHVDVGQGISNGGIVALSKESFFHVVADLERMIDD